MTIYVVVKYLGDLSPDVVYGGASEDAANEFVQGVALDGFNYAVLPVEFDEAS